MYIQSLRRPTESIQMMINTILKGHVMFLYQYLYTPIETEQGKNLTNHDSKASHEDTVVGGETMSSSILEFFSFNVSVKDSSTAWSYAALFPGSSKT